MFINDQKQNRWVGGSKSVSHQSHFCWGSPHPRLSCSRRACRWQAFLQGNQWSATAKCYLKMRWNEVGAFFTHGSIMVYPKMNVCTQILSFTGKKHWRRPRNKKCHLCQVTGSPAAYIPIKRSLNSNVLWLLWSKCQPNVWQKSHQKSHEFRHWWSKMGLGIPGSTGSSQMDTPWCFYAPLCPTAALRKPLSQASHVLKPTCQRDGDLKKIIEKQVGYAWSKKKSDKTWDWKGFLTWRQPQMHDNSCIFHHAWE